MPSKEIENTQKLFQGKAEKSIVVEELIQDNDEGTTRPLKQLNIVVTTRTRTTYNGTCVC